MSDSLRPCGLQHARLPCPSPIPGAYSNSFPLNRWCHTTISSSVIPSIFPRIRVFSNESVLCIRWPKYWSSSFSISPSNEYSGLISFRIDGFDLFAVQGTLRSLESPLELKGTWKFLKGRKQTGIHIHYWVPFQPHFLLAGFPFPHSPPLIILAFLVFLECTEVSLQHWP